MKVAVLDSPDITVSGKFKFAKTPDRRLGKPGIDMHKYTSEAILEQGPPMILVTDISPSKGKREILIGS